MSVKRPYKKRAPDSSYHHFPERARGFLYCKTKIPPTAHIGSSTLSIEDHSIQLERCFRWEAIWRTITVWCHNGRGILDSPPAEYAPWKPSLPNAQSRQGRYQCKSLSNMREYAVRRSPSCISALCGDGDDDSKKLPLAQVSSTHRESIAFSFPLTSLLDNA